jgi:hypothetical protein
VQQQREKVSSQQQSIQPILEKIVIRLDPISLTLFRLSWPQLPQDFTQDYFTTGRGKQLWEDDQRDYEFNDTESGCKISVEIEKNEENEFIVESLTFFREEKDPASPLASPLKDERGSWRVKRHTGIGQSLTFSIFKISSPLCFLQSHFTRITASEQPSNHPTTQQANNEQRSC